MTKQRTLASPQSLSLVKLWFIMVIVGGSVKWSYCTTSDAQFVQICALKIEEPQVEKEDKIEEKIEDPQFETFVIESKDAKLENKEEITQPPDQSDLLNKCETSSDTSKEEKIYIKTEVEDVKGKRLSLDAQSPPPIGMRQTRSMRSRMAPKSKTWFPGERVSTTKKDVFCSLKSPPIKQEVVVKKEHIEVDNKVFMGEGEVANEQFKDNKFEFNEGKVEKEQIEYLKTRHSEMTSILDKLEKKNQQLTLSERASKLDKVEVKQNEQKEEIALCSKIKFRKPVVDIRGQPLYPPSLVPEIEIKPPDIIKDSAINIVQKLSSQVDMTNFDDSETECKDPPSLIEIIQGIKKRKERRKLPPPPLIPLDKN